MSFKDFIKIDYQNYNFLLDELCFMLSRRGIITSWSTKLQEDNKNKEILSIVIGAIELLIALAMAKLINVDVYIKTREIEHHRRLISKKFLLWNGHLVKEEDFLIPYMSRIGLPDIEICENNVCVLVEVTVGLSPQTLYYELSEVLRHDSSLGYNVKNRILLIPACGEDFISLKEFVKSKYSSKVDVFSIYSIIEALCMNKNLEDIKFLEQIECNFGLRCCENKSYRLNNLIETLLKEIGDTPDISIAVSLKNIGYTIIPAIIYKIFKLMMN
jgi:hypothetical protein